MTIKQPSLSSVGWMCLVWVVLFLLGISAGMNPLFIVAVVGTALVLLF